MVAEKDKAALDLMKDSVLRMLKALDTDNSGAITWQELGQVFEDGESLQCLVRLKVDVLYLMELREMIFPRRDSHVSITSIMDLILACRGDRPATVQDVVDGLQFTRWSLTTSMKNLEVRLRAQSAEMTREYAGRVAAAAGAAARGEPYHHLLSAPEPSAWCPQEWRVDGLPMYYPEWLVHAGRA